MEKEARQQFCLKWNNHSRNLANVFGSLRDEELFVDVSLATSDKQIIRAHRVLLSAGSAYLEEVLSVATSEHPTVVLSGVKYKDLKLLVDFMYSGEISVDQQQFPNLLEAARWLKIRGLCEDSTNNHKTSSEVLNLDGEGGTNITEKDNTVRQDAKDFQYDVSTSPERIDTSEESEEEQEVQSPISSDVFPMEEDSNMSSNVANKNSKCINANFGQLNDIASAVLAMKEKISTPSVSVGEKAELSKSENMSQKSLHASTLQESHTNPLINPISFNEQLMHAMQLYTSPFLNSLTTMPKSPQPIGSSGAHSPYGVAHSVNSKFSPKSPPNFKSSNLSPLSSAPVRRYKQYSDESLQAALKEIMDGQSINRSSMKHNIPARTLRDWMKRYNIKSQFTHHSHGKDSTRSNSQDGEGKNSFPLKPDPCLPMNLATVSNTLLGAQYNAIFSQSSSVFPGLKLNVSAAVKQEEEIDDDEDTHLEIDESPISNNSAQIAQIAN